MADGDGCGVGVVGGCGGFGAVGGDGVTLPFQREKLLAMKRYSGFLKRPEILETVYRLLLLFISNPLTSKFTKRISINKTRCANDFKDTHLKFSFEDPEIKINDLPKQNFDLQR